MQQNEFYQLIGLATACVSAKTEQEYENAFAYYRSAFVSFLEKYPANFGDVSEHSTWTRTYSAAKNHAKGSPRQLENYMQATGLMADTRLSQLLDQLRKKGPNVRTNVLQETFRNLAEALGVITVIEEIKLETIEKQVFRYKPKLVVGADGTHSVVNQNLFPINNQIKHEVDYAMQLRYEIAGDAEQNWEQTIQFYQDLARQGLVATEQIGKYDTQTGKTPVTVQLIIPKQDFDALAGKATAKEPIKPFAAKGNDEDARAMLVPKHLSTFITRYISELDFGQTSI